MIFYDKPQQGVYKFNQANFQENPVGILRKIQDMFALLRPPSQGTPRAEIPIIWRPGWSPGRKRVLVHLELERTHLMAINFVFLRRIFIHIFMTGNQCGRSLTSYKNFQEDQLNSRRFPGVVDTLHNQGFVPPGKCCTALSACSVNYYLPIVMTKYCMTYTLYMISICCYGFL